MVLPRIEMYKKTLVLRDEWKVLNKKDKWIETDYFLLFFRNKMLPKKLNFHCSIEIKCNI